MQIVEVQASRPSPVVVARAVEVLGAGGVVALPTETLYGLAADSTSPAALERINRIKGKPADSPILLLGADIGQVEALAGSIPPLLESLAQRFWPGPLTVVLPAHGGTVAIRIPGLRLPREIAAALGRPISGVSANRHGAAAPSTAQAVVDGLGTAVDLLLDGGPTRSTEPSTLVDLSGERPRILREGRIGRAELADFL